MPISYLQSEQKLKEVEEQNKEIKMQQSKYASENYEKIRQMQQIVMTKDREIEKLKCELQNIDVFKAQVGIPLLLFVAHYIVKKVNSHTSRLLHYKLPVIQFTYLRTYLSYNVPVLQLSYLAIYLSYKVPILQITCLANYLSCNLPI